MATRSDLYHHLLDDLGIFLPGDIYAALYRGEEPHAVELPPDYATRPSSFASMALLRSVFKKFEDEIDQESANLAAFEKFRSMNDRCAKWKPRYEELGPYDEVLIGEFRMSMWKFFTVEGYDLLDGVDTNFVQFGPGSAPGAEECDLVTKLGHSTLTATSPSIVDLFDRWVELDPKRADCEIARAYAMGAPEIVETVKITPVPKTQAISRLVKPEPLLNMFFQQGIRATLERRLRGYFGIDLANQAVLNSNLSEVGSKFQSFGTIDLVSASDCIAKLMCQAFIPKGSMSWLNLLRSNFATVQSGDGSSETVELHMIATMGNAFCFPLQTAIFSCVVEAAYRTLGIPFRKNRNVTTFNPVTRELKYERRPGNWGVFGDDIIVSKDAYDTVIRLLKWLGFIPNLDKSFNQGGFRESCGSDWLYGENVRGVYCSTLKTPQSVASLFNRLSDWSYQKNIPLRGTLRYLWYAKRSNTPLVPPWESVDAGLRVPLAFVDFQKGSQTKILSNQRDPKYPPFSEIGFDTDFGPKRPHVNLIKTADGKRYRNEYGSYMYRKWEPRPRTKRVDTEAAYAESGFSNASALLIAATAGHVRGGRLVLRAHETTYRTTNGVAPCWDYYPVWRNQTWMSDFASWFEAISYNLFG